MTSNQDTNKRLTRESVRAAPSVPAFKETLLAGEHTVVRGLNYVDVNVCELYHNQRDLCRVEPVRTLPLSTPGSERSYFYLNIWRFYSPKSYPAQLPIPKCLALLPT